MNKNRAVGVPKPLGRQAGSAKTGAPVPRPRPLPPSQRPKTPLANPAGANVPSTPPARNHGAAGSRPAYNYGAHLPTTQPTQNVALLGPPQQLPTRAVNPTGNLTDDLLHKIMAQLGPSLQTLGHGQAQVLEQTRAYHLQLGGEMEQLRVDMKEVSGKLAKSEAEREKENKRNVEELKALTMIADRMGAMQKDLSIVVNVIGKPDGLYDSQQRGMLKIMQGIEMDLQECLEKARDPTSNGWPFQSSPVRPANNFCL